MSFRGRFLRGFLSCGLLAAGFVSAQEKEDEPAFEELPNMADDAGSPASKPAAPAAPSAPPPSTAASAPRSTPADDGLEALPDEDPEAPPSSSVASGDAKEGGDALDDLPVDDSEEGAGQVAEKSAAEPFQDKAQVAEGGLTPDETDVPPDVKDLEDKLRGVPGLPAALVDPDEPGGDLPPAEKLARVPLRPPMSDLNWRKWAGPMLQKNYRIRRGDTLWGVSERLFGNPYLWPKVWHLNAHIGNPNVIDPGLQLQFQSGNPNSAPELAIRSTEEGFEGQSELPMMMMTRKLDFFEMLDETLRNQIRSPHPPFQYFLLENRPKVLAEVPRPANRERLFYDEGSTMPLKLKPGQYTLARIQPTRSPGFTAYRVRWIGTLRAGVGGTVVEKLFSEIGPGDVILDRNFSMSPLALHEESVGEKERRSTHLVPLEEGHEQIGGEHMLMGVKFSSAESGPRVGAVLRVTRGGDNIATALLVDRDGRAGTVWVIRSQRELGVEDRFH